MAEQILNGVKHRACMRLHRNAVLRSEHGEIKRRHDGGERGGRRLVSADLQAVGIGPDMIGVVDGPRGQPQHLARQRVQNVQACGFDWHGVLPASGVWRLFCLDVTATSPAENLKFWRHILIFWDILPTSLSRTMVYPNERPR